MKCRYLFSLSFGLLVFICAVTQFVGLFVGCSSFGFSICCKSWAVQDGDGNVLYKDSARSDYVHIRCRQDSMVHDFSHYRLVSRQEYDNRDTIHHYSHVCEFYVLNLYDFALHINSC